MSIEIKVGPPVITISQGRTFMVTDQRGFIDPDSDQGVYAIDTRFISFYQVYINRVPLKVINSSQLTFYAARMHLTNPRIKPERAKVGNVSPHDLRHRFGYRMAESVPLHRLAQLMGHDSLDTTMIYIRATRSDLQREWVYSASSKGKSIHGNCI